MSAAPVHAAAITSAAEPLNPTLRLTEPTLTHSPPSPPQQPPPSSLHEYNLATRGALLFDYLDPNLTFAHVAQRHNIDPIALMEWARDPVTLGAIAHRQKLEADRANQILPFARAAAITTLARAVTSPNQETARRAATTLLRIKPEVAPAAIPATRATDPASASGRCSPAPRKAEAPTAPNPTRAEDDTPRIGEPGPLQQSAPQSAPPSAASPPAKRQPPAPPRPLQRTPPPQQLDGPTRLLHLARAIIAATDP